MTAAQAPMVEKALITVLRGAAAVTAIFALRMSTPPLPQNPLLPALTLQLISDVPVADTNQGESGVLTARVQCDVWALTDIAAADAAHAVRSVLVPRRPIGGIVLPLHIANAADDVTISKVSVLNAFSTWEPDERNPSDPNRRLFRRSTDYKVTYAKG